MKRKEKNSNIIGSCDSRRNFIKKTALIAASYPFLTNSLASSMNSNSMGNNFNQLPSPINNSEGSIIGGYGEWAASLVDNPPALSFRLNKWKNIEPWKEEALSKTKELIAAPKINETPKVIIEKQYTFDDLEIEELSWKLPYGNPTKAILLKPKGITKPLPAILALHDHGGNKYFGRRKITKTSNQSHPLMDGHQTEDYGGRAWANEIAKHGYVVLVHDAFSFGSRRVFYKDTSKLAWGKSDDNPDKIENVKTYNSWANEHEDVLSKSLLCAGTTYPGVVLSEDQIALDILSKREDVNPEKIGCGGLSGGGLRTVYLSGIDTRIKCAVSVGFMSTWQDFLLHKAYTHTWMAYTPLLPKYLDFPEIIGLRVPLPTLVLSNNQDSLFTLSEMKKADNILTEIYNKAGKGKNYLTKFYDGDHKFDVNMQEDAFDWFDKWLKS
ncbi:MAG: prolyl oligopeptidase family serine peptidase [Melioribacteraceae bacterium]|nr:prolyl oligopeptidase family serine peptidase [Melioribacteraceae bacterium]